MAVKTHELLLDTAKFAQFTSNDYMIIQNDGYEKNDYILVKEFEVISIEDSETKQTLTQNRETGLYRMAQIKDILVQDGLKDGYVFMILSKL